MPLIVSSYVIACSFLPYMFIVSKYILMCYPQMGSLPPHHMVVTGILFACMVHITHQHMKTQSSAGYYVRIGIYTI